MLWVACLSVCSAYLSAAVIRLDLPRPRIVGFQHTPAYGRVPTELSIFWRSLLTKKGMNLSLQWRGRSWCTTFELVLVRECMSIIQKVNTDGQWMNQYIRVAMSSYRLPWQSLLTDKRYFLLDTYFRLSSYYVNACDYPLDLARLYTEWRVSRNFLTCSAGASACSFTRDIPVITSEGKFTYRPNNIILGVNQECDSLSLSMSFQWYPITYPSVSVRFPGNSGSYW